MILERTSCGRQTAEGGLQALGIARAWSAAARSSALRFSSGDWGPRSVDHKLHFLAGFGRAECGNPPAQTRGPPLGGVRAPAKNRSPSRDAVKTESESQACP